MERKPSTYSCRQHDRYPPPPPIGISKPLGHVTVKVQNLQTDKNNNFAGNTKIENERSNTGSQEASECCEIMQQYKPFMTKGVASTIECDNDQAYPVKILRDTSDSQSFILDGIVPSADMVYLGMIVQGIEGSLCNIPLVKMNLQS